MSENPVSQPLYVLSVQPIVDDDGLESRRLPGLPGIPTLQPIELTTLQNQVNIFLQQINVIMEEAPKTAGGFQLAEFEVSAGIVVEGRGKVNLALIANAEAGAGISATIRFVFKRP